MDSKLGTEEADRPEEGGISGVRNDADAPGHDVRSMATAGNAGTATKDNATKGEYKKPVG